jgi:filamentous hemagglutinin family protein
MKSNVALALAITVPLMSLVHSQSATAQVASDGSLSTTVNSTDGVNFTIENGDRAGSNLFHSFREFSVPTGGSASFNNTVDVQNIFGRVTGGSISNIDGLIRANGTANLFLLNPAGIIFGPNASLNIGGSFLGTTANSIRFADGVEFSATSSTPSPLLTVSTPTGLNMGSNPGAITVNDEGHRLVRTPFTPADPSNNPAGLQVNPGQTLALIGNSITLEGGILGAPSGQVELGSVSRGNVGMNTAGSNTADSRWRFDYGNAQQFADIRFSQQSLVDASAPSAGSIHLQGRNISLLEGSVALLINVQDAAKGDLVINADGLFEIRGLGNRGFAHSLVNSDNLGSGAGNNLIVSAQRVLIQDGGSVITRAYGSGASGNVQVDVTDAIDLNGFSSIDPTLVSTMIPTTFGAGNSGNITVTADRIRITDGAAITNVSLGTGAAGNTTVNARRSIELIGENPIALAPSSMAASAFNRGNVGSVSVTTAQLMIRDGGSLSGSTFSAGDAGNVTVTASEKIEVSGVGATSRFSSRIMAGGTLLPPIFQQVFNLPAQPTGDSGNLSITTPSLSMSDSATVGVNHEGIGNAGDLRIRADSILLERGASIAAGTLSGNGGNVDLNIRNTVQLQTDSKISAVAAGQGNGGRMTITADRLNVLSGSQIGTSSTGAGNAGNLNLRINDLTLNQGQIEVAATGTGNAGRLSINANTVELNRSRINATTQTGRGGNVQLNVRDRLQLNRQSTISADAQQSGNSGNLIIRSGTTELTNGSILSTNVLGTARGGSLSLTSDRLRILDGSQLSASTGGSGNAGSLTVQASDIDISGVGRDLTPSLIGAGTLPNSSGAGGNLMINSDRIRISNGGLISAGTAGTGAAGDVTIRADELVEVTGRSDRGAPFFGYRNNHPSRISASSLTDAPAGSVQIITPLLTVDGGAVVEVSGAGSGGAGNLEVSADQINLRDRARLAAEVAGGDRGNITLNASLINLRRNSQITTNANGTASGGNINLNSQFILGLENSDIVARAQQGSGGNIAIATQGLIGLEPRLALTPESDINASSQVGLNGTINISNPNVDPESGVVELPTELVDASQQVAQVCGGAQDNQFVATGRGGVPVDPLQALGGDRAWSDLRNITREGSAVEVNSSQATSSVLSNGAIALTEASGWRMNGQGQIELVAVRSTAPDGFVAASCEGRDVER